jgi:hypothetical protein
MASGRLLVLKKDKTEIEFEANLSDSSHQSVHMSILGEITPQKTLLSLVRAKFYLKETKFQNREAMEKPRV